MPQAGCRGRERMVLVASYLARRVFHGVLVLAETPRRGTPEDEGPLPARREAARER